MAAAAARLASLGRLTACSSLYSTTPVGFADQPQFLNAVVALATDLGPRPLLEALLALEREFGRDRSAGVANGPRTLDLDILLYGDVVISEFDLVVPHPRLGQRAFVLVPFNEIAPHVQDPRTGATVAQYLQSLLRNSQGAMHGVVQVESDLWRSGACRLSGGSRSPARTDARTSRDHG
jgi:2-amino-4-hydroxy-6-hydroxymethyldihydropteridine diphosphokinase